jgi:hypothetical protein
VIIAFVAVIGVVLLSSCDSGSKQGRRQTVTASARCKALGPVAPGSAAPAGARDGGTPATTLDVDIDHTGASANTSLTGVVWNTGDSVKPLAPVHPNIVRIDGSLQDRSTGPGHLELTPLLDRVAKVRAIGAEPLVILSYMPRWLGAPRAGTTKDPTRVAPYDLDAWEDLITTVVRTLATAPQPAYMFEVWNEPDIPIFWQDTPEQFVAMALRTHQAVANVKRETGKPLEIGGPAAAYNLNDHMVAYLQSVASAHLPLDFVSWHKYANSPFLGPDGAEGNLPEDVYKALAKKNPDSTPLDYSSEVTTIKGKVDAVVAGTGLSPKLIIDEWNVSAGGLDARHDNAEGASLVAGILIEMEHAGLDEAAFYRALSDADNPVGDWGLVHADGGRKPSWWVFKAWSTMSGRQLAITTAPPTSGLWTRATRDHDCVDILVSNFIATGAPARSIKIDLHGTLPDCGANLTTTIATLDPTSRTLAHPKVLAGSRAGAMTFAMPSQSVAFLQTTCSG